MKNLYHPPTVSEFIGNKLPLPEGTALFSLQTHADPRGTFAEFYRDEWNLGPRPVQWNIVHSGGNVLRGVHVHMRHVDMLTMAAGEMILGLRDLRMASPTFGLTAMLRLTVDDLHLVVIPVGVAHGFYFPAPACHIYAVSEAFDGSDEIGCRWDDPALQLDWPCSAPILSERDVKADSLAELLAVFKL